MLCNISNYQRITDVLSEFLFTVVHFSAGLLTLLYSVHTRVTGIAFAFGLRKISDQNSPRPSQIPFWLESDRVVIVVLSTPT